MPRVLAGAFNGVEGDLEVTPDMFDGPAVKVPMMEGGLRALCTGRLRLAFIECHRVSETVGVPEILRIQLDGPGRKNARLEV